MTALGDEGDLLADQIVAEFLEGVEIGVGTDEASARTSEHVLEFALTTRSVGARFRITRREDHHEVDAEHHRFAQTRNRITGEHRHHIGHDGQRREIGETRNVIDRVAIGIDREHVGSLLTAPGADQIPVGAIGRTFTIGGTDHRDAVRMEEETEIGCVVKLGHGYY